MLSIGMKMLGTGLVDTPQTVMTTRAHGAKKWRMG